MNFSKWLKINESNTRYSVEINYRTNSDEVLEGFSKISLGYISAAMKKNGYHVKQVFEENPMRIIVSSRNWDDGEWVGLVTYNKKENCFVVSNGFYNKERKSVSIQRSEKCTEKNSAEVTKKLINIMHSLKNKLDNHIEKLKPIKMKRGPK
jgi:hypothetical protein